MKNTRFAFFLIFICACSCEKAKTNEGKIATAAPDVSHYYSVGQVWRFNPTANTSTKPVLKIIHIDNDPGGGLIIFIHVIGAQSHTWDEDIYYLSGDALNRSVVSLVETNSNLTDVEIKSFASYYDLYARGVQTHAFSKTSDTTVAEFLEYDAKN